MSSTDFSLYTLNSTTGLYDVSAAAVFYISEQDIQNVFKARTDSADFSDISSADLHYYVNMDEWPSRTLLHPVNGMLDQPLSWNPIIDTGVDWDHPDLVDAIELNFEDPIDGLDNDENGYIDDYRGWNFYDNNSRFFINIFQQPT